MNHGSLFAGIGGFDLGFDRAGIETVWTVENDKNCNQVLATHWPDARRYTDVAIFRAMCQFAEPVDIISGGFPCQDLSVAGRRKGLAGERSGLWFQFARIIQKMEPKWVVVENVPGLFSSNGGADFALIVGTLEQFGYCVSWRVLDSQFFGVPQRRRRVFIIGSLGGTGSIEVLFESEGGEGHIAEGKEAGQRVTNDAEGIAGTVSPKWRKGSGGPAGDEAYNLLACAETGQGFWQEGIAPLRAEGENRPSRPSTIIVRNANDIGEGLSPSLRDGGAGRGSQMILNGVRRLTPIECERLQGFPDGWTEDLSDSARYRCLGNAVTVNVAEWIGRRLRL